MNNKVRKVSPTRVITTFAGTGVQGNADNNDATLATLYGPTGVAVDPSTNDVYIADSDNGLVRWVSAITRHVATLQLTDQLSKPTE